VELLQLYQEVLITEDILADHHLEALAHGLGQVEAAEEHLVLELQEATVHLEMVVTH
jgi:hypothetical protein